MLEGMRQHEKAEAFRALHEGEPFVIPNPWDAGSAKVLAALGFKALAGTSSGFAFTLGRADGSVTLEEVVAHVRMVDDATDLPLSMDLENGYGPAPDDAAQLDPEQEWQRGHVYVCESCAERVRVMVPKEQRPND